MSHDLEVVPDKDESSLKAERFKVDFQADLWTNQLICM